MTLSPTFAKKTKKFFACLETYEMFKRISFKGDYSGYEGVLALLEEDVAAVKDSKTRIDSHVCWRMIDA